MIWDWAFVAEITPILLDAAVVTLQATIAAYAISLVLGLGLALARFASPLASPKNGLGWKFLGGVVEFVRSTPILVQLYFAYYVLPTVGITLPAFLVGALVLGIHYATYLSEVYRAGIESVPRAQWEASRALNHGRAHLWFRVVLPQAVPPMLPVLGNYFISLLKETPMLSAITIIEMLGRAKLIGIEYYRYLEPLTVVGVLFIIISVLGALGVRGIEKAVGRSRGASGRRRPIISDDPKGMVLP